MNKFHQTPQEHIKHTGKTQLPIRATKTSAGYDFFLKEDIVIPKMSLEYVGGELQASDESIISTLIDTITKPEDNFNIIIHQVLTWTDVSIELDDDKYLQLVVRSSVGNKLGVMLSNTLGIIDSDYFTNPSTGGNIGISLRNLSNKDLTLKKGERIAQGIISTYAQTKGDTTTATREGGFGSSGKD